MTVSVGYQPWTLTMPAGSLQSWTIGLAVPGTLAPYPITGFTWEYVVRPTATDLSTPLIDITTAGNSQGQLIVTATSSASLVTVALTPAATVGLTPGQLFHSLWANPSTTSAFTWLSGNLIVLGNPQP